MYIINVIFLLTIENFSINMNAQLYYFIVYFKKKKNVKKIQEKRDSLYTILRLLGFIYIIIMWIINVLRCIINKFNNN